MRSPVLGIDLGTTNSVVAHADEARVRVLRDRNGHLLTPSSVSFSAAGAVTVGRAARDLRTVDAEHTVFSIKRLIGRPFRSPEVRQAAQRLPFQLEEAANGGVSVRMWSQSYSLPEISAFILKHLREVAERALGQACTHAVITVPANFNELQRMATRDAGRIAGLQVLRILNEPTAAALAYGYRAQHAQRIAVYDFGGGTFDISILELSGDVIEVVATAGDTQLGGDDIDRAIADRMLAQCLKQHAVDLKGELQAYERLCLAAEWIKCQLSERELAEATVKRVSLGDGAKLDLKFQLARSELQELCAPWIERTFVSCEDALRLAGVRPSQLDAVLLVGGQTRTPAVRAKVREFFGMEPKFSIDPELAVAHGAALQGYALSGAQAKKAQRPARTSAGAPAPAAPPDAAEQVPLGGIGDQLDATFDDEPTRVGLSGELLEAERAAYLSDRAQAEPPRVSSAAVMGASLLPSRQGEPSGVAFNHTLPGMGGAESVSVEVAEAITVTSDFPTPTETPLAPARSRVSLPRPPEDPEADDAELPAVLRDVVALPWLAVPVADSGATVVERPGQIAKPKLAGGSVPPPPLGVRVVPEEAAVRSQGKRPPLPPAQGRNLAVRPSQRADAAAALPPPANALPSAPVPASESASPRSPTTPIPGPEDPAVASEFPPPPSVAWVLLDVTPHTLCVETVGGYCESVIERNAPIPTEQTRIFTTSRDNQTTVSVRVCQGESRTTDDNQVLGQIELLELRPARQGQVNIAVTFTIDQDGTLRVRALDQATGRGQELRVNLTGAIDGEELERLRTKQQALVS